MYKESPNVNKFLNKDIRLGEPETTTSLLNSKNKMINEDSDLESTIANGASYFKTMLDALPCLSFIIDRSGYFIFGNELFYEDYEITPSAIIGKHVKNIFNEEYAVHLLEYINQIETTGKSIQYELEQKTKYFERKISPIIDANGSFSYLIVNDFDVTKHKNRLNKTNYHTKNPIIAKCISSISQLLYHRENSLDGVIEELLTIITNSFQSPKFTSCRILINGRLYQTNNFKNSGWNLIKDIFANNKKIGELEVSYLKEPSRVDKNPFTPEEINIINIITERIGFIFELKQSNENLKITTKSHEDTQKLANIGSWCWDKNSRKVQWSNNLCFIHNIQPEQFDGKIRSALSSIHPEDITFVKEKLKFLMVKKQSSEIEFRIITSDGQTKYLFGNQHLEVDKNGNIQKISGILQDITARKTAEETLKESEQLLRTIADNYPNSYLSIIEKDYSISFASGQEFKNQNIEPELIIGKTIYDVFQNNVSVIEKHYEKTFNGEKCMFEHSFANQNLLFRTVPLYSQNGSVNRILSAVENITERKIAEAEYNNAKKQLSEFERLAATGKLAASVAHEINNPLQALKIHLNYVKKELPENFKERSSLLIIEEEINRIKETVEQLLNIHRNIKTKPRALNVNAIINSTLNLLQNQLLMKKIKVIKILDTTDKNILGLKQDLFQVFMNIILNASDSMRHGGILKIETKTNQDFLTVSIRDNGCGISEKDLNQIFKPFFTTKYDMDGTGLGLYTSYSIIEGMGGDIIVNSILGEGSEFLIKLPINRE